MAARKGPSPLRSSLRPKVWGSRKLSPWFPDADEDIGEVWYEHDEPLPILVKLLFTSGTLSVQVHPDDEYAARHENSRGKTEMWHVLRVDPDDDLRIALGLKEEVSREELRRLAVTGEIDMHLSWRHVKPGDTFFVPAGTIHAIGPGLVLCEIQENSDVTYRLHDWDRPRDLHIDKAVDVAIPGPYRPPENVPDGFLAWCPYFAVRKLRIHRPQEIEPKQDRFELFIALKGSGTIDDAPFRAGQVWHVPAGTPPLRISPNDSVEFLNVFVPDVGP